VATVQISAEGKLGLLVGLVGLVACAIGLVGSGVVIVTPSYISAGWALIVSGLLLFIVAAAGAILLAKPSFLFGIGTGAKLGVPVDTGYFRS